MFCSRNSQESLKHPKTSFVPEKFAGHFWARNWNFVSRKAWEFHLKCSIFAFWIYFGAQLKNKILIISNCVFVRNNMSICILEKLYSSFMACCRRSVWLNNGLFAIRNTPVPASSRSGAGEWGGSQSMVLARGRGNACICGPHPGDLPMSVLV